MNIYNKYLLKMYFVCILYLIIKTYDANNSLYNEKQSIHGAVYIIMSPIYSYTYQFTIHSVFIIILICYSFVVHGTFFS